MNNYQKSILQKLSKYPLIQKHMTNISSYLQGCKKNFSASKNLPGSKFQQNVWHACSAIPYGRTISYAELAAKINCQSAQAVGTALKNNPCPIVIPCHRVIKSSGEYGQYALGKDTKQWLIKHEKRVLLP